jgi:cytochrome c peroxidase
MKKILVIGIISGFILWIGCKKPDPYIADAYNPTPYELQIPQGFPQMVIPADNPMTVEGVELGRKLFYEKKLSGNFTMSCGSCHSPQAAFSDTAKFSTGIDGIQGNRQSMALINLGWNNFFFWDGRAASLEDQIFQPVPNPIEMHLNWPEAVSRLQYDEDYPTLFKKAFNTYCIDSVLVSKAIAQFVRTMISGNSRFDKYIRGEVQLTTEELSGQVLFNTDRDINNNILGADCFHCHNYPFMQLPNEFHNNALDASFADPGRMGVTGNAADEGRFKVPTIRNWLFSAPFIFCTLYA